VLDFIFNYYVLFYHLDNSNGWFVSATINVVCLVLCGFYSFGFIWWLRFVNWIWMFDGLPMISC
jgi:hypothetical protein